MLESLTIENFQTWKRVTIHFGKITTIAGESDFGKSAIIRAIRWWALNRPNGDGFKRHGAKFVRVTGVVDGVTIKRTRGKSNTYHVNGQELKAFGTGVPDLVADRVNVDDVNFQLQHDGPFWFCLSPPEVSRQLNDVIDLGVIDTTLSTLSKESRRIGSRVGVLQEQFDTQVGIVTDLEWVDDCENDWNAITRQRKQSRNLTRRVESLTDFMESARAVEDDLGRCQTVAGTWLDVVPVYDQCRKLSRKVSRLETLLESLHTVGTIVGSDSPDFSAITTLHTHTKNLTTRRSQLSDLITRMKENRTCQRKQRRRLEQAVSDLPSICPTCGNNTTGKTSRP